MERMPQSDVLTPEQIYTSLKTTLAAIEGVDFDVLKIMENDLLHADVDEKKSPKNAIERLLELAARRAEERPDDSTAG